MEASLSFLYFSLGFQLQFSSIDSYFCFKVFLPLHWYWLVYLCHSRQLFRIRYFWHWNSSQGWKGSI